MTEKKNDEKETAIGVLLGAGVSIVLLQEKIRWKQKASYNLGELRHASLAGLVVVPVLCVLVVTGVGVIVRCRCDSTRIRRKITTMPLHNDEMMVSEWGTHLM